MVGNYDGLTREQLVQLLEKRDRQKKLGLVWERDEIEADRAIDENFIACEIDVTLCERASPWRNLVIEGDNFDALRWLRMAYAGRVKCIYIDPPYNTGTKDWVFNDRYFDQNDRYRHSTWLEFLYRRVTLARDLLTDDGVMLVSINENNRARLELLLDEALPGMRVGSFVWKTRAGTTGEGAYLSQDNEYVLVYAKPNFRFGGTLPDLEKYKNPDNDPRESWVSVALQTNKNRIERPNSFFPVQHPRTGHWYPCNPNRVWSFQLRSMKSARGPTFEDMYEAGLLIFSREGETQRFETPRELLHAIEQGRAHPYLRPELPNLDTWVGKDIALGSIRKKQFLRDLKRSTKPVSSWVETFGNDYEDEERIGLHSGMTQEGTKAISKLFGERAFNYAKPPTLIRELLRQSTSFGDLVVDFFAGSATTAQAVMELNAEDNGERTFIMVSSKEATLDEPDKNLCRDITAKRIRLLNAAPNKKYPDIGAEFSYLRSREIKFEDLDYDLKASEVWAILEAMHDLPLTEYQSAKPFQIQQTDGLTLIYVDRFDPALIDLLATLGKTKTNVFVYAWAPGQISQQLDDVDIEIKPVRETLVKRFQQ